MADELPADPAQRDSDPTASEPTKKPRRSFRRVLIIVIAILAAFVVYAFAFEKTDVSLDELQSETRQDQLFRILRALARPDLIHYDKDDLVVEADVYVPCTATVPEPEAPAGEGPTIVVTPSCAEPEETMTVHGTGFEAEKQVSVHFVPDSEFDVTLPLGRVETDESGDFSLPFEVPKRPSENAQQVRAVTSVNIGGWFDRVQVWTDTNKNGVQDPQQLPEGDGEVTFAPILLPQFDIRDPGGVALIDPNGNVIEFISWGGSFEATNGRAIGETSRDIGVDPFVDGTIESAQLTGPADEPAGFVWVGPDGSSFGEQNAGQEATDGTDWPLFINELAFDSVSTVEIGGAPGTDLLDVGLTFYGAEDGQQYRTILVADRTDLSPRLSDNALQTWDRIIETVMLALLATTVGTMLAVPLSFLAAKNLMKDVTIPVINLALILIGIPIGLVVGVQASRWARTLVDFVDANAATLAIALAALAAAAYYGFRAAFSETQEEVPSAASRALRVGVLVAIAFGLIVSWYLIADLFILIGDFLGNVFAFARFLGAFVSKVGELFAVGIPVISSLIGAGIVAIAASRFGYWLRGHVARPVVNGLTFVLAAIAGATFGIIVGAIVDWFGQFDNRFATMVIPAIVGMVLGLLVAARALRRESQNVGLTVYYGARTLFNGLRSIEPLVMVIIFVVWVGIGPFAGALALALHTTAALAKLYSEQVESIATGPLEAVRATGATRLQTVVYAVAPQIVPPYISFTMYRWDINVRMSTIIGFAGGGGIGFLLQQNINLLQYRAAAAQMLAIAIVVATMDYISSRLRERLV